MQTNLKCVLMTHTPDPERVVAAAARLCYSKDDAMKLMQNMTPDKIASFITKLEDLDHKSPFEHTCFTFSIEGVSRTLSLQLLRHRIASPSQRSQRYVSESDADFIMPSTIENNVEAKQNYLDFMKQVDKCYNSLILLGIPKEDARYVLPNATETKLVLTMNARSLYNFFNRRCCIRAQWEIRALANMMLNQVRAIAPQMFRYAGANCVKGWCPESIMSCGRVPTLDMLIRNYKSFN